MISTAAILALTPVINEAHDLMWAHLEKYQNERYSVRMFEERMIRDGIVGPFIRNKIKEMNCVSIKSLYHTGNNGSVATGNDALNSTHFDNICTRTFSGYNHVDPGKTILTFLTQVSNDFDVDIV